MVLGSIIWAFGQDNNGVDEDGPPKVILTIVHFSIHAIFHTTKEKYPENHYLGNKWL